MIKNASVNGFKHLIVNVKPFLREAYVDVTCRGVIRKRELSRAKGIVFLLRNQLVSMVLYGQPNIFEIKSVTAEV